MLINISFFFENLLTCSLCVLLCLPPQPPPLLHLFFSGRFSLFFSSSVFIHSGGIYPLVAVGENLADVVYINTDSSTALVANLLLCCWWQLAGWPRKLPELFTANPDGQMKTPSPTLLTAVHAVHEVLLHNIWCHSTVVLYWFKNNLWQNGRKWHNKCSFTLVRISLCALVTVYSGYSSVLRLNETHLSCLYPLWDPLFVGWAALFYWRFYLIHSTS